MTLAVDLHVAFPDCVDMVVDSNEADTYKGMGIFGSDGAVILASYDFSIGGKWIKALIKISVIILHTYLVLRFQSRARLGGDCHFG